jgi:prepilin-type N-terminal cleavage/methylation domain-containing protein
MNRAFTLIELLIVVSIIGILAVALVPRLTDAPSRARDVVRFKEANDLIAALELYNIDNSRYLPSITVCLHSWLGGETRAFVDNYLGGTPPNFDILSEADGAAGAAYCEIGVGDNRRQFIRYRTVGTGYQLDIYHENPREGAIEQTSGDTTFYMTTIDRS